MRLRRILALFVLVAALGTYLWVYEIPRARREAEKAKLLPMDTEAVTAITLASADGTVELRKEGDGWRLVQPVDARADDAAVKALLTTLADAEIQKTIDELPADLASFGLDTPKVTVRVTRTGETEPTSLAVGRNTPIGGKVYVRRGDEPKLHLTSTSVSFGLTKKAKDLRDKQLLTFKDEDVTRVEIAPADGARVMLVRAGKDAGGEPAWTVEPGGHPADPTEVRSYLSSLRSTRAVDFPDDAPRDLAAYGLDAPRLTVAVTTGPGSAGTQVLELGSERKEGTQTQVYARRADRPTVYALGDWSTRSLGKTAGQLRDKTVLGFDPARVGRVTVERKDGGGIRLVRAGDDWQLEGVDPGKTKKEEIGRFLDDLHDLRGSEIVAEPATDLAPYGLDAPDLRITLADKEQQPIGTVVGAKRDGKHYVMRAGAATVFETRDYMYTRLDKPEDAFVESGKDPKAGGTEVPATAGEG